MSGQLVLTLPPVVSFVTFRSRWSVLSIQAAIIPLLLFCLGGPGGPSNAPFEVISQSLYSLNLDDSTNQQLLWVLWLDWANLVHLSDLSILPTRRCLCRLFVWQSLEVRVFHLFPNRHRG